MKTDETTRPVKKQRTPEEIEALRARKRARMLAEQEAAENGVEEVRQRKRTPEEIEALRARKRARMLAEQKAAEAGEAPVRRERTPEEIEAIRARKRARMLAEAEAEAALAEAVAAAKRTRLEEEDEDAEIPVRPARRAVSDRIEERDSYEEDLGEPEGDMDFDEDELAGKERPKKKRSFTWLLILLLILLLAAVGAFAYLFTGTRAIGFEKESYSVLLGERFTLKPVFTPSFARDKSCTLYSENPDVIQIDENGELVALKEGVAKISAVQNGVLYGTTEVTVGPVRVTAITFENVPESMIVGESFTPEMKYMPENATHPELELSVSDELLASLENGTVTALAPGLVTITATNSHSGLAKEAEIAILPVVPTYIELNIPEVLNYGEDFAVRPEYQPENTTDRSVVLTSSDPAVVEIDGMALIPKNVGTATITAEHSSGLLVAKDVTVYPKVTLSGNDTLAVKKSQNLTLTTEPECETGTVEWSSSNTAVATVSNRGKVKAVGGGVAVITAKLPSGAKGTFELTVPAVAQKCRNHMIIEGNSKRRDVIEIMGMSEKNTVVKLECVDDPQKSCMILVAKTGAMTTKTTKDKSGKTSVSTSSGAWRVKLPSATFNVKIGFGDTWYGDTLLFGADAEYYDLHTTFTVEKDGSLGISALSRAKNKEKITYEQFIG